ncbi:TlpA family protein disulfide reductase [Lutibacter sp. A64]|uniref:TlpA family protein disulfide reductase n=1 Tax=Lutibacter sp. A64 TaxID=2918526 RepID=UPI001F05AC37|nr:TlpA disulfide reductase family protein [Lutibacter sp. A64]UMB53250.1 TlpA family protein disulfide reductase [Lutibacter sp. A64]
MQNTILLLISLFFIGFTSDNKEIVTKQPLNNATIPVYNFSELEPLLYTDSEKIHIVNFWAMWCAPCVKELPIFQAYEKNNENVEMIFVSLDFPEDIETKLKPFLEKKGITSKVVLLDDPDANTWIDKIDPNWSGAIPFTIVFNKNKRSFHERAFENIEDLETEINNTINN